MIEMDKTAKIWAENLVRSNGSETSQKWEIIYTICDFWTAWSGTRKKMETVRESKNDAFDVIIPISLSGIVIAWMSIELFAKDWSSKWVFKIDVTDELWLWDDNVDNILLSVTNING